MNDTDHSRVARLCPALRAIVEAELKAGNRVVETWEGWGFVVMLASPFVLRHSVDRAELEFRDVDDPHYWKSEYRCGEHAQTVACRF